MTPAGGPGSPLDAEQLERAAIWGDLDPAPVAELERRRLAGPKGTAAKGRPRVLSVSAKVALAILGFWLFLVALAFMKDGARGLAPALGSAIETPLNALGLGWLGALLVLSGSPVAASSLALFASGSLSVEQSYAMVVGSRLGAAFVVLVVATLYALRRADAGRRAPISIGVVALLMTAIAYVPGGLLGLLFLRSDILAGSALAPPSVVIDLTEAVTAPAVAIVEAFLDPRTIIGGGALFLIGVVLLLSSFRIVDVFLPDLTSGRDDERARWYVGPWTMFALGLGVAFATLSVSVALTVLVPVVAKGYVRREQILPYIAGANITTLVDTLLVAVLVGNGEAPRIVLAVAAGITLWTVLLLLVAYPLLRTSVFALQAAILRSRPRLVGFVGALFLVPLALLVVR